MAAYGQAEYVAEAIESVLAQTYADWQLTVVDDGSPDNVAEIVGEYARRDSRIRFVATPNRGVSAARNRAAAESDGEFLLPLDADDTLEPTYIERCVAEFARCPELDVVYSQWRFFGATTTTRDLRPYRDYATQLTENRIFVSAMFRRDRFMAIGGYDEEMRQGFEDWEFWIRFLNEESRVLMLPDRLFNYRIKPRSRNATAKTADASYDIQLYLLAKHKPLYSRYYGSPVSALRYKRKYLSQLHKRLWRLLRRR